HPSGQPHPPHGQLPETGAGNLTLIGTAGALLLAAGVPVLLTANRRRRPQAGSADQGSQPME
ncbi:LPXTG cell wall anchor domain-containing protein, partial [Kitasatospora sp. NPDC091257]|uniref:LPXTG cell wall anchor domain-containing protein n=1 Tax=Kitasatospora sp. NPDC091257 TaxID=3364084 RepID=UPI00381A5418